MERMMLRLNCCLLISVVVILITPIVLIVSLAQVTRLPTNLPSTSPFKLNKTTPSPSAVTREPTTTSFQINNTITATTNSATTQITTSQPSHIACRSCNKTETGTRFILLFMENNETGSSHALEVYPSKTCRKIDGIKINVTWSQLVNNTRSVLANNNPPIDISHNSSLNLTTHSYLLKDGLNVFQVPNILQLRQTESSSKAVVVEASNDIGIYAMNKHMDSCDGFMVLPNHMLGRHHFVACYFPQDKQTQIAFVAVHDETRVQVKLRLATRPTLLVNWQGNDYRNGDIIEFNLTSQMTVQLKANSDFTGSEIISNKPIAVFSGNDLTKVSPKNDQGLNLNYLVEQIPPIEYWGMTFHLAPFFNPQEPIIGYQVKIVCSAKNTSISTRTSNKTENDYVCDHDGDFFNFFVADNTGVVVWSSENVLVMQIFESSMTSDPSMVSITPTSRFNSYYNFPTAQSDNHHTFNHTIQIVCHTNTTSNITLDKRPLPADVVWKRFQKDEGGDGYVWTVLRVAEGMHELESGVPMEGNVDGTDEGPLGVFGVVVLGSSSRNKFCSYAYSAGMCA